MHINFKQVLEGWRNDIFHAKDMEELIHKVSSERLLICQECPHNSNRAKENGYKTIRPDYHCTICLCPLYKKTKCLSCECPEKKWEAVSSVAEQDEIFTKLNIKE